MIHDPRWRGLDADPSDNCKNARRCWLTVKSSTHGKTGGYQHRPLGRE